MKTYPKISLLLSALFGLMSLYYFITQQATDAGVWLVGFFIFLTLGFRGIPALKGLSFTILIFAAVSISMYFPAPFIELGGVQMKVFIVPLLQKLIW